MWNASLMTNTSFNAAPDRRRTQRFRALFLSLLVVATACAPSSPARTPRAGVLAGLDAYVESSLRAWKAPGMAIAIVKNGRVVRAGGFGVREIGRLEPVDEHTLFDLEGAANVARPHTDGHVVPYRDVDNIGPAASINSTAADMARWLLLHLDEGTFAGRRILSDRTVGEMHTPQTLIGLDERLKKLYPESHFQAYGL